MRVVLSGIFFTKGTASQGNMCCEVDSFYEVVDSALHPDQNVFQFYFPFSVPNRTAVYRGVHSIRLTSYSVNFTFTTPYLYLYLVDFDTTFPLLTPCQTDMGFKHQKFIDHVDAVITLNPVQNVLKGIHFEIQDTQYTRATLSNIQLFPGETQPRVTVVLEIRARSRHYE